MFKFSGGLWPDGKLKVPYIQVELHWGWKLSLIALASVFYIITNGVEGVGVVFHSLLVWINFKK